MINTTTTIQAMPKHLAAFKKYIEKYECTYQVNSGVHSIIFYHKETMMPYVRVSSKLMDYHAVIHVNYQADNWSKSDCQLRTENLISFDMKQFIAVMHECKESEREVEIVSGRA